MTEPNEVIAEGIARFVDEEVSRLEYDTAMATRTRVIVLLTEHAAKAKAEHEQEM